MDTGKLLVDLVEFKAVTFNKLSLSWRGVAILLYPVDLSFSY